MDNYYEFLQELKEELSLEADLDNLDKFEKELIEVFQLVKVENKLLKERLVENLLNF
jgi:regulator of replication initiation timing